MCNHFISELVQEGEEITADTIEELSVGYDPQEDVARENDIDE